MAVQVFTKSGGKSTSKVTLPKAIFDTNTPDTQLLKEVYLAQAGNQRQVLADTKNRSAVRGGGRKPWRQKGTGRARAGTIRSPLWRGGGVIFGPDTNRSFSKKTNAKSRKLALSQALSLAAEGNRIKVIDSIEANGKTKELSTLLGKLEFSRGVIVVEAMTDELKRASSNLAGVEVVTASRLSATRVLHSEQLLITKTALDNLSQRLGA